jgi:site-specific DNA-methyltransferase (adenine-specific)
MPMSDYKIICGDSLTEMKNMPNNTINCIITSPPYNVNLGNNKYKKDGYNIHDDNMPYDEYLNWMKSIFTECYRILTEDGRLCVNIGDGKNGKIPTHSDFIQICKEIGFLPMTTIIWNKNNTSNRCAWGSYLSAKSPSFPRPFEYVLVFSKTPGLLKNGVSTITKDEWVEFTNGLWTFAPEKEQKKIGHPAMFPVELPYRLIKMLTYEGDVILDPFMGVATTGVACLKTDRNFIGIEIDKNYCLIGETRLNNYK